MRHDNQHYRKAFLAMFSLCALTVSAVEPIDSVDVYQQHVVTSKETIQGRTVLTSNHVDVRAHGDLTLSAPGGILITNNFEVREGGMLQLNGGYQYYMVFTYDQRGNQTQRTMKQ